MRKREQTLIATILVLISACGVQASARTASTSFSPSQLTFASQTIGTTSAAQSITVANTGSKILRISGIAVTGDFAQVNNCGSSLAAGAKCTISATFTPTATGTRTGSISVTDNGSTSVQTVSLTGTAVAPLTITTTGLPGGTVGVAYSTTLAAANGSTPYSWTDPACSGACNTGMLFSSTGVLSGTPVNAGTSTFTFQVKDAAGNIAAKQLSITIAAPTVSTLNLSPASLTFGSQTVGTTSSSQTVTLTNPGATAVSIGGITTSNNFSQSNNCGTSLAAGANCSIVVLFDPASAGTISGSVAVTDSASSSPQAIALTGTGVTATHSVSLSWAASTSTGVVGYDVYRSTTSGSGYSMLTSSPLASATYTDSTVASGTTYYYVTTAVNSSGEQSSYSNQATAVVP